MCVQVLELAALALDLDLPADLAAFVRQAPDDPLAQYCLARARESFPEPGAERLSPSSGAAPCRG